MQLESTFQLYNASAGSGKTFILVKEYLKILLTNKDIFRFQKILAITFTNKAAGEMKERVLKNLQEFSEGKRNVYFEQILDETNLEATIIIRRSKSVLNAILQNYSSFYITTIDSFTHKIIKSFAFDLGLSQNFEVEMDADELLYQAVERLISKVGINEELTEILVNYSLEKTDDDKSWDISKDLVEFSKVLLNENDVQHLKKLTDKSLNDFNRLRNKLIKAKKELRVDFKTIGEKALEIINHMNLEYNDFYRSMLPNHFLTLKDNPDKAKFFEESSLKLRIEESNFYAKSKSDVVKTSIEEILSELLMLYDESEKKKQKLVLINLILKSIVPLAVLNHIHKELEEIKEENNLQLNAEFNQLISENIQNQPAPFIYEKIGQKFQHYFIDEMQDTSVLQWRNLIPLIGNSLAQEGTSLLLVGDAKQAIYRWRGGKAEQFIGLGKEGEYGNPFQTQKINKQLLTNYRSSSEVIDFNNDFFKHCSKFIQNEDYKALFSEKAFQKKNESIGGFVSLSFLEKEEDKEEEKLKYAKKVLETIQNLDRNFSLSDICVLVRKKREGVVIANYLSEKNINIVSSETLLLSSSERVNFVVCFLQFIIRPNDKESFLELLDFLYKHLEVSKEKHHFFENSISLSVDEFFNHLSIYNCHFRISEFQELPFYEKVEQIINVFKLNDSSDSYIQFFLDVVLEQQRKGSSIQDFLDFWETKKDKLSIVSSDDTDAVKIMTIHKSKGLEFPIVIFPCDVEIYQEINPKIWIDNLSDDFEGFSEFMIPARKEVQYINETGSKLYNKRRQELELDNFNLLYVALTRAEEQLHVITDSKVSKKIEKTNYYSGIFTNYLKSKELWNDDQREYSFGTKKKIKETSKTVRRSTKLNKLLSNSWKNQNIKLLARSSKHWGTEQQKARDYGDLIHEIMSKIVVKDDIPYILNNYVLTGVIDIKKSSLIEKLILKIVNHNLISEYYTRKYTIYNERKILDKQSNTIIILDRLAIIEKNVVIIDYKTGKPSKEHYGQLNNYQRVLESLNFKVIKKILVYIHDSITVEEF